MLNKVLEIHEENRYLSLKRGFIVIYNGERELGSVPLDDIAVLLVTAQSTTFSKNLLNALSDKGGMTVLCGKNYSPQSMVMPVAQHYLFAKIVKFQINSSLPLKKRLWQKVVIQKIRNQSLALKFCGKEKESEMIEGICKTVKSGDSDNREAYAARLYWKYLMGNDFIRDKNGDGFNAFLNYGYAIMRAAMARAICSNGLIPSLGIHHDNNLNAFCLADDLFEIYRPMIDCLAYKLWEKGDLELTPEVKLNFANCLNLKLQFSEIETQACLSMQYMVNSFVKSLEAGKEILELPDWSNNKDGITIIE